MNINDKRRYTNLTRYGVDNVSKLPEIQAKRKTSFYSKTNVIHYKKPPISIILDGHMLSIYKVDTNYANNWLDVYHPLRRPRGNELNFGLVQNNTLYCIMSFKKPRDNRFAVELCRMWTLSGVEVLDGYNILSKYSSYYGLSNIVAYVNLSFESCSDYEDIGMISNRYLPRKRWWVNDDRYMRDDSRRQYKFSCEHMIQNGWLPAYDCGQTVHVYDK